MERFLDFILGPERIRRKKNVARLLALAFVLSACGEDSLRGPLETSDNSALTTGAAVEESLAQDLEEGADKGQSDNLENEAAIDQDSQVGADENTQVGSNPIDTLLEDAVTATCDALYRCCNKADRVSFFSFVGYTQKLIDAGFESQVPPNVTLTHEECAPLVREIYEVQPLGPWIEAVKRGYVDYHPEESEKCLENLRVAQCGEELRSAVLDPTCFAFAAPESIKEPRKMFSRKSVVGDACVGLTDGVGGTIYGSCDPTKAWCCRASEEDPANCSFSGATEGSCVSAGSVGDSCGLFPEFSFCGSGLECAVESGICELAKVADLAAGELCYAETSLLGDCVDSFCDVTGTGLCEPLKAAGAECVGAWECADGACNQGLCGANEFCSFR